MWIGCEASARTAQASHSWQPAPSSRATETGPWVTRPSPKAVRRPRRIPSSCESSLFRFCLWNWKSKKGKSKLNRNQNWRTQEFERAAAWKWMAQRLQLSFLLITMLQQTYLWANISCIVCAKQSSKNILLYHHKVDHLNCMSEKDTDTPSYRTLQYTPQNLDDLSVSERW